MTSKSPEAFRTISEVSEELDIPQHVLRFWESKFAALKPLKRGGGRRYYRPGDVDVIRGIKTLLYVEGYTIRGVQKVFRTHGVRFVADVGQYGAQALAQRSGDEARAQVQPPPEPAVEAEPLAPAGTEPAIAEPAMAEPERARPAAQLSLVEPSPLKLATVDRRRLNQHLQSLVRLRGQIGAVLAAREERLAPAAAPAMPMRVAAEA